MNDEPTITPPTRALTASLLIATGCAVVTGVMTILMLGVGSPSAEMAALAIAGGSMLMAWPAMLGMPMPVLRWGMILIVASVMRLSTIMLIGLLLTRVADVELVAYMLGLVVGCLTLLAIDTALLMKAIWAIKPVIVAHGDGHA